MKRPVLALLLTLLLAALATIPAAASVQAVSKKTFPMPPPGSGPISPAVRPDGNVWFLAEGNGQDLVARITRWGKITEFPLAEQPQYMIAGPDGNLWFTVGNAVASITTSGVITEHQLPTAGASPEGLAIGSDGRIWIDEQNASQMAAIDLTTDVITEYPAGLVNPVALAAGPDGRLWYISQWHASTPARIAAMSTTGHVDLTRRLGRSGPSWIVAGPDGAMWVPAGSFAYHVTTTGTVTTVGIGAPGRNAWELTVGPDGAFWFVEQAVLYRMDTSGAATRMAWLGQGAGSGEVAITQDGTIWITLGNLLAVERVRLN